MSHQLETIIGYKFKNPELLEIALTHTSYANESRTPVKHNERLEFLGDSVLQIVSADYLFHAYADRPEGDLTRIRASLVSEGALFQFAQEIDLGEYLRLGRGEERCGGRTRPSVVSDAFEAVIAALYLDGGMEVARKFILPFITEGKHAEADYKTRLQEIVQQNPEERLSYVVESESGPDHDKHFVVAVRFNSDKVARGEGRSKKMAEITADAWETFKGDYLRLEKPTFSVCYYRLQRIAEQKGWTVPSESALRRRLNFEVSQEQQVLFREGEHALHQMYPPQVRTVLDLTAMEWITGDGYQHNVFVKWFNGEILRPKTWFWMDIYSRKIVGWRTDVSENTDSIRLDRKSTRLNSSHT